MLANSPIGFNRFPSSFNVISDFLWNLARIGITVPSPSNTELRTMERGYILKELRALSICQNWPAGPLPEFRLKTFSFEHTIADLTDLAEEFD